MVGGNIINPLPKGGNRQGVMVIVMLRMINIR